MSSYGATTSTTNGSASIQPSRRDIRYRKAAVSLDEGKGQDSIAPIIAGLGSGTMCISMGLILLETFKPAEWPMDVIGIVCLAIGGFLFLFSLVVLHIRDYRNIISRLRSRAISTMKPPQLRDGHPRLTNFLAHRSPVPLRQQISQTSSNVTEDRLDSIDSLISNGATSNTSTTPVIKRPKVVTIQVNRKESAASSVFTISDSDWLDLADATDECMFECLMPGSPCCGWLPFQNKTSYRYDLTEPHDTCEV